MNQPKVHQEGVVQMWFKTAHGINRWVFATAGLVSLLMLALGMLAGQARAAVPAGQSGSFLSSSSMFAQALQPHGGPTHGMARIVINGSAPGSVTWSPPGLKNFKPEDCPGVVHTGDRLVECYFERGTVVTFTATPDAGYKFYRWDGVCKDAGSTCKVTIDYTITVAARFTTADDVPGPGPKRTTAKCKRAKQVLKRARARLNKARKQTRKARKSAKKKAKARQKNAQKTVKRAQTRVRKAC